MKPLTVCAKSEMADYQLIHDLVALGLYLSVFSEDGVLHVDTHLDAKSHLILVKAQGKPWVAHMRYGVKVPVTGWRDLLPLAVDGMHGRPGIDSTWRKILTEEGYL